MLSSAKIVVRLLCFLEGKNLVNEGAQLDILLSNELVELLMVLSGPNSNAPTGHRCQY